MALIPSTISTVNDSITGTGEVLDSIVVLKDKFNKLRQSFSKPEQLTYSYGPFNKYMTELVNQHDTEDMTVIVDSNATIENYNEAMVGHLTVSSTEKIDACWVRFLCQYVNAVEVKLLTVKAPSNDGRITATMKLNEIIKWLVVRVTPGTELITVTTEDNIIKYNIAGVQLYYGDSGLWHIKYTRGYTPKVYKETRDNLLSTNCQLFSEDSIFSSLNKLILEVEEVVLSINILIRAVRRYMTYDIIEFYKFQDIQVIRTVLRKVIIIVNSICRLCRSAKLVDRDDILAGSENLRGRAYYLDHTLDTKIIIDDEYASLIRSDSFVELFGE